MRFTMVPPMLLAVVVALGFALVHVSAVAHVRRKAPMREKKAYDTNVRGFSPDGNIFQVEYAVQAAEKGGLTIGVQTEEGLVLAAQGRRRSPLLKSESVSKISEIDTSISCAMSGLLPDARLLADFARSWVQEHRFEFDEAPSVEAVASQMSWLALKFNGYDKDGKQGGARDEDDGLAMSRPMGVAFLVAGLDRGDHPVLYHLDPSGAYVQWRAKAIGEKATIADTKLEEAGPYMKMTVRQAMSTVLRVLNDVLGDDFSTDCVEMVCMDLSCKGLSETTTELLRQPRSNGGRTPGVSAGGDGRVGSTVLPETEGIDGGCGSDGDAYKEGGSCESSDEPEGIGRSRLFRRVGKEEMGALLLDEGRRQNGVPK